ncbi:hypothetical protein ABT346_16350 [Micromonospora peucetia]|uniref:hypothetical protein n=1 Tax=Micromonospora peucetia TaxID=47871 RepID=UPI00332617F9
MRKITVHLDVASEGKYADILNAIWMQLEAVGCDFTVLPDEQAVPAQLDKRWDEYSRVSWVSGGERGTAQAIAASGGRPGTLDPVDSSNDRIE